MSVRWWINSGQAFWDCEHSCRSSCVRFVGHSVCAQTFHRHCQSHAKTARPCFEPGQHVTPVIQTNSCICERKKWRTERGKERLKEAIDGSIRNRGIEMSACRISIWDHKFRLLTVWTVKMFIFMYTYNTYKGFYCIYAPPIYTKPKIIFILI